MTRNEKNIESYILNGVVDLIGKSLGSLDKLVASIKKYVKNLKPKIDIGTHKLKLELTVDTTSDPAGNVKEGLFLLERLLSEKQKSAVLLMDEFQNVGIIAQGKGIEGAIRHVAQKTKYLTFIFSGSNRKLLRTMFEDETRPLYKLCWKISLSRILAEDYQDYLQKAAKSTWSVELNADAINEIFLLTERHPYYLNKLCDRLWTYCREKPPSLRDIEESWKQILEEEKSDAIKEISLLSLGQKNVLCYIAKEPSQLTSKKAIFALQMTSSSILTALEGLEEKDVIEREDHHYRIINPVVKFYVLKSDIYQRDHLG